MPPRSPTSGLMCSPLQIVDGTGTPGAGLGGRAPEVLDEFPGGSAPAVYYFATVPLRAGSSQFVSLFVADLVDLMPNRARVNEVGLLRPVVHAARPRAQRRSPFDSKLSEHGLLAQDEVEDWILDDEGNAIIRPGHKLGGRPHLVRVTAELSRGIDKCRSEGLDLIAQFDFPSGNDALVKGDWPFADGMFFLFGREPWREENWRWSWDF